MGLVAQPPRAALQKPLAAAKLLLSKAVAAEFDIATDLDALACELEGQFDGVQIASIKALCETTSARPGFAECVDALVFQASSHFNETFPSEAAECCFIEALLELSALVADFQKDLQAVACLIRARIDATSIASRAYSRLTQASLAFDLVNPDIARSNRAAIAIEAIVSLTLQHLTDDIGERGALTEAKKAISYTYFTTLSPPRQLPSLRTLQVFLEAVASMRKSSQTDAVLSEAIFELRSDPQKRQAEFGVVEALRQYLAAANSLSTLPRVLQ